MMSERKCALLFFLSWNMLLFSAVLGRTTNRLNDDGGSVGQMALFPGPGFQIPVQGANVGDKNDLNAVQSYDEPATVQNSANNNASGVNENQNVPLDQPNGDILSNLVNQIIARLSSSLSNANSNDQIESDNNPPPRQDLDFSQSQNNSPVENSTVDSTQPQTEANDASQNTSSDKNGSDSNSINFAVVPVAQGDSPQNSSTDSSALVPTQNTEEATPEPLSTSNAPVQNEPISIQNDVTADQQPSTDQNYSTNEIATPNESTSGCGITDQTAADDSQPKLELNQVTASQILYHLKMQYEDYQLDSKQGEQGDTETDTYELTQKTFLREILRVSNENTLANNKNIVSTTYAAYYSTEYTYTFALCKLHHITKAAKDPQNPAHAEFSSKCSKIMETFSSFNTSYKEIISEVASKDDNQVLKYDNHGDGITNTSIGMGSKSDDHSNANKSANSNPPTKKISTDNSETIEKQNLEKDLRGYNDNNFYNRVRSEGSMLDQFDFKQNQKIGDSTYSNETKGKKNDSAAYLLSEIREIPKDKSPDDPSNGTLRLRKMSNTLRTDSKAETKGHIENGDVETNSDRLQEYNKTQKQLDQLERNYFDDDNGDIGGNIKDAKLQDVESHYSATVEHIRDTNEQETKPKDHENYAKKYTFKKVVEKLTSYIRVLHVFIGDMEKNVTDNNRSSDDAFNEMHESIYQQTFTYRKYLKEYFASTNVESGTFGGNKTVDTIEEETESLLKTVEKRFSWLKNIDAQGLSDSKSTAADQDEIKRNPIKLLWFLEEASFYWEHFVKQSQVSVPFMSYLPYPNFDVKALSDNQDGVDIQFYLN